jgi:NodT family efflux transporter outer membrane factor (OMF) lipoprotein
MRWLERRRMHTASDKPTDTGSRLLIKRALPAFLLLDTALLGLSGCSMVGPDYSPPAIEAPVQWNTPLEDGLSSEAASPETLANWWTVLGDPLLDSLEQRAVKGNLSLKEAAARVREARALRGINEAALLPSVDGNAAASSRRSMVSNGTTNEGELYTVGFDAGWELDIFGGKHRAVEAARAEQEASVADLHDVLVSLMAEIGLNYVEVRTNQARLAAAEANLATQQHTYELNLSRYQAGLINKLDVQQSLSNLEHTRSQVPLLQTGLATARNRLAVLLGQDPGALDEELAEGRPVPVPPLTVAIGVPADNLRQRPDIRRAERNLAASTALIGVATADLYPKFQLFGSIGLESLALEDLPEWASRTWSIGPAVSWRLFDAGAIRQNIAVQNARQEQALLQYESAVLTAREEVENALVAYLREQNRRDALTRATEAARQAELLARDRYKAGLVDFNTVLDAQRSLLSFEDELASSEGEVTAGLIRLYKAMGGGWQYMAGPEEPTAAEQEY